MKTGKTGDFYQEKGLRFKTYRSKKKKNAPNMFIALKTTRMMTERLISITYSLRFCF